MNLYVFIIMLIMVSNGVKCKSATKPIKLRKQEDTLRLLGLLKRADLDSKRMRSLLQGEAKDFETIVETVPGTTTTTRKPLQTPKKRNPKNERNYQEIKLLLGKLLEEILEIEKNKREEPKESCAGEVSVSSTQPTLPRSKPTVRMRKKKKDDNKQKWGHWTDWSSCSVSCGKGRQIRWRHCLEHCEEAETEMEEKTCQLPACGPGKLFGVIKLK